jgi:hypothetical protein
MVMPKHVSPFRSLDHCQSLPGQLNGSLRRRKSSKLVRLTLVKRLVDITQAASEK